MLDKFAIYESKFLNKLSLISLTRLKQQSNNKNYLYYYKKRK